MIDKLVVECSENIYENETVDVIPLNAIPSSVYKKVCNSCMIYIVLFVIFLITTMCICSVFKKSKECDICHYWYFLNKNFNYQKYLCNGCHDLMQKAVNFNDVAIVCIKENDYRIHFWYMS